MKKTDNITLLSDLEKYCLGLLLKQKKLGNVNTRAVWIQDKINKILKLDPGISITSIHTCLTRMEQKKLVSIVCDLPEGGIRRRSMVFSITQEGEAALHESLASLSCFTTINVAQ